MTIFIGKIIIGTIKALLVLWPIYLIKNPKKFRYCPRWILSFFKVEPPWMGGIPGMNFEVIEWLDNYLTPEMMVFEWGSGGSTIFIAKSVKKIISVEDDRQWHNKISQFVKRTDCELILREPFSSEDSIYRDDHPKHKEKYAGLSFEGYCRTIDKYPDNYFDLVVIDGRARMACISRSASKIKHDGYLLLDDTHDKNYSYKGKLLEGWERTDFYGPRPYGYKFCQTSIWKKKR